MFGGAGNNIIKLIDFGMSCMTINNTIYSVKPDPICTSSDLFFFCTYLYQYDDILNFPVNVELHRLFDLFFSDGDRFNIYTKMTENIPLDVHGEPTIAIYHRAYPFEYEDESVDNTGDIGKDVWNKGTKVRFNKFIKPKFEPGNFSRIWTLIHDSGVGAVTSLRGLNVVPEKSIIEALMCGYSNLSQCKKYTIVSSLGAAVVAAGTAAAIRYGPSVVAGISSMLTKAGGRRSHRRKHRNNRKTRHRNKRRI
jgi:hypothetical protein